MKILLIVLLSFFTFSHEEDPLVMIAFYPTEDTQIKYNVNAVTYDQALDIAIENLQEIKKRRI